MTRPVRYSKEWWYTTNRKGRVTYTWRAILFWILTAIKQGGA